MTLLEMILRLLLAAAAGALVGLERERRDRPAGLRTHALVCLGSALITLTSIMLADPGADRTRIAAQIVTGIGFLGAGTIFRAGIGVRGLTTAAGLWVVAGIGMGIASGGSLLVVSVFTAFLVYAINQWLRKVEERLSRGPAEFRLTTVRGHGALSAVFEVLHQQGARVQNVHWMADEADAEQPEPGHMVLQIQVRLPEGVTQEHLTSYIAEVEGVRHVEWE